jgi:hypothetical protein
MRSSNAIAASKILSHARATILLRLRTAHVKELFRATSEDGIAHA